jgi:hypothetical protein
VSPPGKALSEPRALVRNGGSWITLIAAGMSYSPDGLAPVGKRQLATAHSGSGRSWIGSSSQRSTRRTDHWTFQDGGTFCLVNETPSIGAIADGLSRSDRSISSGRDEPGNDVKVKLRLGQGAASYDRYLPAILLTSICRITNFNLCIYAIPCKSIVQKHTPFFLLFCLIS